LIAAAETVIIESVVVWSNRLQRLATSSKTD